MAKKNELTKAREAIMKKEAMVSVIQSVINDMEWNYNNAMERFETTQSGFEEFKKDYSGDEPIAEDYRYKDYLASIESHKARIEAYEVVQNALLKLI